MVQLRFRKGSGPLFDQARNPSLQMATMVCSFAPLRHRWLSLLWLAIVPIRLPADAGEISYNHHVAPIFAEYCLHCHGPDEGHRQAGLRLDIADSGSATAIIPGNPEASEIILRMTSDDPDVVMPPASLEKRPTTAEIDMLRQWIARGGEYQQHWSYQPIAKPELPLTAGTATTAIDRFIVAALESQGLSLSARVDRRQLIRRASFDLLGLPPTPAEVESFVNDPDETAFAKVVDRMLDSPRYGERWGRHWLDVARYADTHGGSAIGYQRFAFSYTYRDYVIQAFNEDLPYNRFLLEQLAADQLGLEPHDNSLAALGFLTVGMQFRNVHDVIDDQIDVITRGLMGMTVACARCHDHKFDAIPTTDYYALYASLAPSEQPDELPILGSPQPTAALREYQQQLDQRRTIYRDMTRDQCEVMRHRLRNQVGLYLTEIAKGAPEQDVSTAFLSYRTDDIRPLVLNRWRDYLAAISADDPVFGPWVRLSGVEPRQFVQQRDQLLEIMRQQNGDPASFAEPHRLSVEPPAWNPRLIAAIETAQPESLVELADVYGRLFAAVQQQWLQALLAASREAGEAGTMLTDEDPQHAVINSAIDQQLRRHLFEPGTPTAVPDPVAARLLNRTVSDNLSGKRQSIHSLHLEAAGSPPRAMVLRESADPPTYHVFQRGNPLDRAATVEPRFLTAIAAADAQPFRDGRRRFDLAQAIVAAENPLTRRVIVNWIWRHHFGLGLVRTPDDLGTRGTPPTHPELLDYLASVFAEDGWSIKRMHRRIMLSDVYQQAAVEHAASRQVDPENELLWRMPRRRLEMEAMRDAMLAVSGELDLSSIGGRPFDFESDPVVPRRSVYGFINRDVISNLGSTFDAADPTSCTVKRPDTIVPQQALYALNSGFVQDRAAHLATLAAAAATDAAARVDWLYQRLYTRPPTDEELQLSLDFIAPASVASDTAVSDRWVQLAHVLLAANEFVYVD